MPEKIKKNNLLDVTKKDQFRTVEELLQKRQPDSMFYVMLVLSSLIIAAGVVLSSVPIIIGGMLVTPLLTQFLVIALGLTVGEVSLVVRTGIFILKATLAIITGSFLLGLIFGNDAIAFPSVVNTLSAGFLYFVVAVSSGVAVTLAWIRREVSEVLPGVAIAVSLVPPLSYIGVGISQWNLEVASFFIVIYVLNLFGIILGSLGVFSLSRFNRMYKEVAAVKIAQEDMATTIIDIGSDSHNTDHKES
ncbi:MAG: putative hydrophobic protein (TIGR00271 family) [Planctomycetota bacterium]|jgi:uncharacterized hydrophobic protein (TIGR00271 family)